MKAPWTFSIPALFPLVGQGRSGHCRLCADPAFRGADPDVWKGLDVWSPRAASLLVVLGLRIPVLAITTFQGVGYPAELSPMVARALNGLVDHPHTRPASHSIRVTLH